YVSDGQEHPAEFHRRKRAISADSTGHLSQIRRGLQQLSQMVEERGDATLAETPLPRQITDYLIQNRPEMISAGALLNQAYVGTLSQLRRELGYVGPRPLPPDIFRQIHDRAYDRVQKEYERYRPVDRPWLSLGALVSAQLNGEGAGARAAWLTERRQDEGDTAAYRPVPFRETLDGLRRLGLAADLVEVDGQAQQRWRWPGPGAAMAEPEVQLTAVMGQPAGSAVAAGGTSGDSVAVPAPMLGLDEVPYWLDRAGKKRPGPVRESRVPSQRGQARTTRLLRQMAAEQRLAGRELHIKEERDGLYAVNAMGQPLGKLSVDTALGFTTGQRVVLDTLYLYERSGKTHTRFSLQDTNETVSEI
ncbi:MAG: hypothetical protein KDE04_19035, partial [Anaerolineales bacterium]|nr:hypothetical protein [Anaerolineales bacterium]